MKKFLLLSLFTLFIAADLFAQADSTGTGGINLGGWHLSWALISAIVIGIEGILRAIPSNKYASLLGLIAWINDLIPTKKKIGTNQ